MDLKYKTITLLCTCAPLLWLRRGGVMLFSGFPVEAASEGPASLGRWGLHWGLWTIQRTDFLSLDKRHESKNEAILLLFLDLPVDFEASRCFWRCFRGAVARYDLCHLRTDLRGLRKELWYPSGKMQSEIKSCPISHRVKVIYFSKYISSLVSFDNVLSKLHTSAAR